MNEVLPFRTATTARYFYHCAKDFRIPAGHQPKVDIAHSQNVLRSVFSRDVRLKLHVTYPNDLFQVSLRRNLTKKPPIWGFAPAHRLRRLCDGASPPRQQKLDVAVCDIATTLASPADVSESNVSPLTPERVRCLIWLSVDVKRFYCSFRGRIMSLFYRTNPHVTLKEP